MAITAKDILEIIIKVKDEATNEFKKLKISAAESFKSINKQAKALQGVMMSVGLSMLFTGMAIKRAAENALNAIASTYSKATGEQSMFNQEMNKLAAAWEFFKFSLMDALVATGLFQILVDLVLKLVNWFNGLSTESKSLIVIGLIFSAILGTIMMIVGQIVLFGLGVLSLISYLSTIAGIGAIIIEAIMSILTWFFVIVAVIIAIVALFKIWRNESTTTFEKILQSLMVVGAAIAFIALFFGLWTVAAIAALVAIVAAVIFYFDEIVNFFTIMNLNIMLAWTKLINWLVLKWFDGLIWMAQQADSFINGIIRMLNKLPMFNIGFTSNAASLLQEAKANAFAAGIFNEAFIKSTIQDVKSELQLNDEQREAIEQRRGTNNLLEEILLTLKGVSGGTLDFSNSTGA